MASTLSSPGYASTLSGEHHVSGPLTSKRSGRLCFSRRVKALQQGGKGTAGRGNSANRLYRQLEYKKFLYEYDVKDQADGLPSLMATMKEAKRSLKQKYRKVRSSAADFFVRNIISYLLNSEKVKSIGMLLSQYQLSSLNGELEQCIQPEEKKKISSEIDALRLQRNRDKKTLARLFIYAKKLSRGLSNSEQSPKKFYLPDVILFDHESQKHIVLKHIALIPHAFHFESVEGSKKVSHSVCFDLSMIIELPLSGKQLQAIEVKLEQVSLSFISGFNLFIKRISETSLLSLSSPKGMASVYAAKLLAGDEQGMPEDVAVKVAHCSIRFLETNHNSLAALIKNAKSTSGSLLEKIFERVPFSLSVDLKCLKLASEDEEGLLCTATQLKGSLSVPVKENNQDRSLKLEAKELEINIVDLPEVVLVTLRELLPFKHERELLADHKGQLASIFSFLRWVIDKDSVQICSNLSQPVLDLSRRLNMDMSDSSSVKVAGYDQLNVYVPNMLLVSEGVFSVSLMVDDVDLDIAIRAESISNMQVKLKKADAITDKSGDIRYKKNTLSVPEGMRVQISNLNIQGSAGAGEEASVEIRLPLLKVSGSGRLITLLKDYLSVHMRDSRVTLRDIYVKQSLSASDSIPTQLSVKKASLEHLCVGPLECENVALTLDENASGHVSFSLSVSGQISGADRYLGIRLTLPIERGVLDFSALADRQQVESRSSVHGLLPGHWLAALAQNLGAYLIPRILASVEWRTKDNRLTGTIQAAGLPGTRITVVKALPSALLVAENALSAQYLMATLGMTLCDRSIDAIVPVSSQLQPVKMLETILTAAKDKKNLPALLQRIDVKPFLNATGEEVHALMKQLMLLFEQYPILLDKSAYCRLHYQWLIEEESLLQSYEKAATDKIIKKGVMAELYQLQKKPVQALECYLKAIDKSPEHIITVVNILLSSEGEVLAKKCDPPVENINKTVAEFLFKGAMDKKLNAVALKSLLEHADKDMYSCLALARYYLVSDASVNGLKDAGRRLTQAEEMGVPWKECSAVIALRFENIGRQFSHIPKDDITTAVLNNEHVSVLKTGASLEADVAGEIALKLMFGLENVTQDLVFAQRCFISVSEADSGLFPYKKFLEESNEDA